MNPSVKSIVQQIRDAMNVNLFNLPDTIEITDCSYIFGQFLRLRPLEIVKYGYDIAITLECFEDFLKEEMGKWSVVNSS